MLLHALCLLSCCLPGIIDRQPSIVFMDLAPFSKISQVGICSHQTQNLGVNRRRSARKYCMLHASTQMPRMHGAPFADGLLSLSFLSSLLAQNITWLTIFLNFEWKSLTALASSQPLIMTTISGVLPSPVWLITPPAPAIMSLVPVTGPSVSVSISISLSAMGTVSAPSHFPVSFSTPMPAVPVPISVSVPVPVWCTDIVSKGLQAWFEETFADHSYIADLSRLRSSSLMPGIRCKHQSPFNCTNGQSK